MVNGFFPLIFLNFLTNQIEGNETLEIPKINKESNQKGGSRVFLPSFSLAFSLTKRRKTKH